MPYNFAADSIHTKKICSRLSSRDRKRPFCVFEPLWADSGWHRGNVHLRLIGKRGSGLSISDNCIFPQILVDWDATSENRLKIGVFEGDGSVCPKTKSLGIRGRSPQVLRDGKLGWSIFYGIKLRAEVSFVLSQFTHLTDTRTDRRRNGQRRIPRG